MLSVLERAPLPHRKLSAVCLAAGITMALAGLGMLLGASETMMVPGVAMIGFGVAMAFVAGFYTGCGNNSCSPRDW